MRSDGFGKGEGWGKTSFSQSRIGACISHCMIEPLVDWEEIQREHELRGLERARVDFG